MAAKKTGISRDLIIHPGETIADILEARNITQTELAIRTGVTPVFVGKIISGQKNISGKFAVALEYALNIPKSFWLNLQARYDKEILEADEEDSITNDEKEIRHKLDDVVKYVRKKGLIEEKESISESIISLRRLFNVSNLCNLDRFHTVSAFRMGVKDKIDPHLLGAWIRLCQIGESENHIDIRFDKNRIDDISDELKSIMLRDDDLNIRQDIKNVLSKYGIDFDIIKNFSGAPVQGFLYKRADGGIRICMTLRRAFADIFWFSLFHELGHLVNGDLSKAQFIEMDGLNNDKEKAADEFASNKLLDNVAYTTFLNEYNKCPSYSLIEKFAGQQKVKPYIVIGRMQKEKRLKYSEYPDKKIKYTWSE